jgi:hypothetical protein
MSEVNLPRYRTKLIRIITFLAGLYFVLEFILPETFLNKIGVTELNEPITNGFIAVGAMAMGLGLINIISVHGGKIVFARKGAFYSSVLLFGLVMMILTSSIDWYYSLDVANELNRSSILGDFALNIDSNRNVVRTIDGQTILPVKKRIDILVKEVDRYIKTQPDPEENQKVVNEVKNKVISILAYFKVANDTIPDSATFKILSDTIREYGIIRSQVVQVINSKTFFTKLYSWLLSGLFNSLGAAMFSLLSVYIAVAAYRAFRIQSFESLLMMIAAVIVILGQIPFTLYISDFFPQMRLWLMEVPSSAAFRAIKIGSAIAGLIMAESFSDKG